MLLMFVIACRLALDFGARPWCVHALTNTQIILSREWSPSPLIVPDDIQHWRLLHSVEQSNNLPEHGQRGYRQQRASLPSHRWTFWNRISGTQIKTGKKKTFQFRGNLIENLPKMTRQKGENTVSTLEKWIHNPLSNFQLFLFIPSFSSMPKFNNLCSINRIQNPQVCELWSQLPREICKSIHFSRSP